MADMAERDGYRPVLPTSVSTAPPPEASAQAPHRLVGRRVVAAREVAGAAHAKGGMEASPSRRGRGRSSNDAEKKGERAVDAQAERIDPEAEALVRSFGVNACSEARQRGRRAASQ
jgi:hypothetical protein